eukprot:scaffold36264_cov35-Attheya_sp.AAC.1
MHPITYPSVNGFPRQNGSQACSEWGNSSFTGKRGTAQIAHGARQEYQKIWNTYSSAPPIQQRGQQYGIRG